MSEKKHQGPPSKPATPTNFPPAVKVPKHLHAEVALARARERRAKVAGARARMQVRAARQARIKEAEVRALRRKMGLPVPVAEVAEVRPEPVLPPEVEPEVGLKPGLSVDEAVAALDSLDMQRQLDAAPLLPPVPPRAPWAAPAADDNLVGGFDPLEGDDL